MNSKWIGAVCAMAIGAVPAGAAAQDNAPQVKVGGVVYAQYLYQLADAADGANNFDINRAYVNVTGALGGGFATRVTADIYRVADGSLAYRLKYAYGAYTPKGSPIAFKLGQMQTPWIEFEETLWDFRMQGTVALDRNGYMSSSDFGAGIDGSWSDDLVSAQAGVYNGEGYSRTPGDKGKDVMGRLSVRLMPTDEASRTGGLRLSGYGQHGSPTGGGVRQRALGMLSYRSKLLTLAGEYAMTRDRLDDPPAPALPDPATIAGRVVTAFGVLRIPRSPVSVIGRVDVVDPDTDAADDRRTRYIGGVAYQVTPNLRLLADIDHLAYQGGAPSLAAEAARSQGLFQASFSF
jgi:hypothetical protein